jgi:hypothetical protein
MIKATHPSQDLSIVFHLGWQWALLLISFFLYAFGAPQSKCDIFWRFWLFVRLVGGRWKVSDSFHRTVETIKTWWKLTNFGGNYF